jgi:ligand-binding sensor domain-containing protein
MKHFWRMAFCFLIWVMGEAGLFAQNLSFKQLNIESGLTQRTVYCIVQDHLGFLWIGTQDGLNRYDGYGLTVFKNSVSDVNSISDNRIRALYLDPQNVLWVGTSNGLNRFDFETQSFKRYFTADSNGVIDPEVRTIEQDSEGNLWLGTGSGGITKLNPQDGTFGRYRHNPDNPNSLSNNSVLAIEASPDGRLWFGTLGGGLDHFDPASDSFEHYRHEPEKPGLSSNFIMALHLDSLALLWIGTYGGGLNRLDTKSGDFSVYRHDPDRGNSIGSDRILGLFEDHGGTLWVGTLGGGLNHLIRHDGGAGKSLNGATRPDFEFVRYQNNPNNPSSLSNDIVRALWEDRSHILWVGTNLGGLSKLDLNPAKFQHFKHNPADPKSLSDNNVNAFCIDHRGTLWVGTNEALNKYDPAGGGFVRYNFNRSRNSQNQGYIFDILEDRLGFLWVATYGEGLFKFDPTTSAHTQFRHDPQDPNSITTNRVTSLLEDRFGHLWIGTVGGLNRYNLAENEIKRFRNDPKDESSLSDNSVWVLFADSHGNVWVGTDAGGLNLFDFESESFRVFKNDPADNRTLSNNTVNAIFEDEHGHLWVATRNGLNRFDISTEKFEQFYETDGLPQSYITGVLGDDHGFLWLSSNKGLTRFAPNAAVEMRSRNYGLKDGLQGLDFHFGSYYRAASGEMFFGGVNGFNRFFPHQVQDSPFVPPVVITSFKKFGKDMTAPGVFNRKQEIDLNYKENYFSIEFAALDFTYPEGNQYAYKLDGLDEDWIYSGTRRYVNYSNLNPGSYVFRVKGTNSDGIWNEDGASLAIHISPPFWKTWWFRSLLGLAIIGLLGLAYNYRVSQLLEIERTRNRIARDLHDDIGGTLSSINYFAQAIRSEARADGVGVPDKFLSLISESSQEAQEAITDIIWSIDPGNDRWDKLFAKFRRFASDLLESKGISYEMDIPENLPAKTPDMEKRRHFWLIFKEMISNAARHSSASQVRIVIAGEGRNIRLLVADNGVGFNPEQPSERHGIANVKMRAKILNADLELQTGKAAGTHWVLRFSV